MDSLNQAVYLALSAASELRSDSGQAPLLIRQAFVDPAAPPPPEAQDVLYFHLVPGNRIPQTEESFSPDGHPAYFRFSQGILNLVFYGPLAEENAWLIYHVLFLDGYRNPRGILRRNGIYPVPHPPGPVKTWEIWKEQHRLRMDLVIPLHIARNEILSSASAGSVETPPDLRLTVSGDPAGHDG